MTTGTCLPASGLPGVLREARRTIEAVRLDGTILGHVGDGNYHAVFPVDPQDEEDLAHTEEVNAEIVDCALAHGGTSTSEHGTGSGKMEHLQKEHGNSLTFMRKIKKLADPNGILNPGKLLTDDERGCTYWD